MIQITPISLTATAQTYCSSITETLCCPYCLNQTIQPQPNVSYSVGGINVVNGIAYVDVVATGAIIYQPKGWCGCNTQTKLFTEVFTVAFVGTGTPTVVVAYTPGLNAPSDVRCCNVANAYNITGEVVITATFPA